MRLEDMSPVEHLDRAEQLVGFIDKFFDETGKPNGTGGGYVITPVQLTLADLHLKLAAEKRAQM